MVVSKLELLTVCLYKKIFTMSVASNVVGGKFENIHTYKSLMTMCLPYKTILYCHSITNHHLNYFKIIILKVNKLTIHDRL